MMRFCFLTLRPCSCLCNYSSTGCFTGLETKLSAESGSMQKLSKILVLLAELAVCAVLLHCLLNPHGKQLDHTVVERVRSAWRAADLPYTEHCDADDPWVYVTSGSEFDGFCRGTVIYESCLTFDNGEPLVVLREDKNDAGHVDHELLHWLEYCSFKGIDYAHQDLRVWGPGGVLEQLNTRE